MPSVLLNDFQIYLAKQNFLKAFISYQSQLLYNDDTEIVERNVTQKKKNQPASAMERYSHHLGDWRPLK